jgi:NAD(P)-dependent dehydrogenase (short-subunit alcohol dehydrogenase family)
MALTIDLTGRKAIVSGVSSGIGAGIAASLAQAGCDIAGCALAPDDDAGATAFLQSVRSAGRRGIYQSIDLSDANAPAQWVQQAATQLEGVDIIVSNAGRNVFAGVSDCTEQQWAECINLDLASHWRLANAAHKFLARSGHGVIVLISSNHAERTIRGCFPYNVAKAGLNALVQSLSIEWGPRVRTVGLAPGFINTPANDAWFNSFPDPSAERKKTENRHPVGRLGTPYEIGNICAFLASDLAGFISGNTILVDGGRSAILQDA